MGEATPYARMSRIMVPGLVASDPARVLLSLEDRSGVGLIHDRIAVPVNELPGTALMAEDVGDTHDERSRLIAPLYRHCRALDLHRVGQVSTRTKGEGLDLQPAAAEAGGRKLDVLTHLVPAALVRAKPTEDGHVGLMGIERLEWLEITRNQAVQCCQRSILNLAKGIVSGQGTLRVHKDHRLSPVPCTHPVLIEVELPAEAKLMLANLNSFRGQPTDDHKVDAVLD